MASFRTHTNVNNLVNVAITLPGVLIVPDNPRVYMFSIGMVLSTCFMGPDADMNGSIPDLLTGQLFWQLYSKAITHRSIWSHGIGLGTIVRVIYVETIPATIAYVAGMFDLYWSIHFTPYYYWCVVGIFVADNLHIFVDYFTTFQKS